MTKEEEDNNKTQEDYFSRSWVEVILDAPPSEREALGNQAVEELLAGEERVRVRTSRLTEEEIDEESERISRGAPDYPESVEEFYERVYIKNGLKELSQKHDKLIAIREKCLQSRKIILTHDKK